MTLQNEPAREKKSVRVILPWLVAVAALGVFIATLNPWVSLNSLRQVARISGWMWAPETYTPFSFLVTFPFRWLPAHWVPMALNLFSAVCGALTLALLARSVMLLPHDRTHGQREREQSDFSLLSIPAAWVPPVLAAMVCGLQFTFWEIATSGSFEMFELLLLAYVIRNLLEYRVSGRDGWLFRAALVCGAAMTETWVMILLFPAFLAALVWIKGLAFFNLRFLSRMALFGLGGLLLYLLLPLAQAVSDPVTGGFWLVLKANLAAQKTLLQLLVQRVPNNILLLLTLTSLLPILLIAIRWASYFGDPSRLGILITTAILHLAHFALLGACIWVAFDPVFSPRHKGLGLPAVYYLGALSVGYFSGYFLLVFKPIGSRMRNVPAWETLLHRASQTMIWALLIVVPAGLVYRNVAQIRFTNGPSLQRFARMLTQPLPERATVLSDDESRLYLARAWTTRERAAENYIFIHTAAMYAPRYHAQQRERLGDAWAINADPASTQPIDQAAQIGVLAGLADKQPLYYLHHSFGFYFEYFYPKPHGLAYEMKPYPTNDLVGPPLTVEDIAENEKFWSEAEPLLDSLEPFIRPPESGEETRLRKTFLQKLHIAYEPNVTAVTLAVSLSQPLNVWGGILQQAGRFADAGRHFERALGLYPDSISAKVNLEFNRQCLAGQPPVLKPPRSLEDEFGKFRDWQQVLRETGPFDEPTHCFGQGLLFAEGGYQHQTAQQFERVRALVPDNAFIRLLLARLYLMTQLPERCLELVREIEAQPHTITNSGFREIDVLQLHSAALFAAQRPDEAERLLQQAIDRNPTDRGLLGMVVVTSSQFQRFTNALLAVERQLQLDPDNTEVLVNKGFFNIQLGNFDEAIRAQTRVLEIGTNSPGARVENYHKARLNRAIAYLGAQKLDEARQDYEVLEKAFPGAPQVYQGLAEVAFRGKDTNAAIRYFELFLDIPANPQDPNAARERAAIQERLDSLKSPSP